MAKALDYSFARPDPAAIKRHGYTAVIRYLAPLNESTRGKIVNLSEARHLRRAGLDLVLNWEWYESRATEGTAAGREDGRIARLMARALGYPDGAAIYFSCDMDTHKYGRTNAYFRAAREALGRYRMGVYGGYDVVAAAHRAHVIDLSWQTVAWSNGHWHPGSVLRQTGEQVFGQGADVNIIRGRYYGSDARRWVSRTAPHPAAPKTTPPKHRASTAKPVHSPHATGVPHRMHPIAPPTPPKPAANGTHDAAVTHTVTVKGGPPHSDDKTAIPRRVDGAAPLHLPAAASPPALPTSPAVDTSALSAQDISQIIDERMGFWLPRLVALLRRGTANHAFTPDNCGSLIDGVGLDGIARDRRARATQEACCFAAVDSAGRRLDDVIWLYLGVMRVRVPSAAIWMALNPSNTVREVTADHPLFALPEWPATSSFAPAMNFAASMNGETS